MPPGGSPRLKKERRARLFGYTRSIQAFSDVATKSNRINIIAEGDSWFAYPPEWLVGGPNSNIMDHILEHLSKKGVVNTLCRPSNGDTAVNMMKGTQYKALKKLLEKKGEHVDLFLFSAGGNDVVGEEDLMPLLNEYKPGYDAHKCIKKAKLKAKLDSVIKAYEKLIKLRNSHAPDMHIVTHEYDILKPSKEGAEFLWGVEVMESWIYPSLKKKKIPETLHVKIVEILLGDFKKRINALATRTRNFHVANTQPTLRVGNKKDWLNEIHPTPSGFKRIAKKFYRAMRGITLRSGKPKLPAFN